MKISFTGHRQIGVGSYPNKVSNKVCFHTEKLIKLLNPEYVYTGMATGFDTFVALICIKLNIPFIAAIPFVGQENQKGWTDADRNMYDRLLAHKLCKSKIIVCEGDYDGSKYQKRNEYLVDNGDILVACFDGSPSGTANCLKYANSLNKYIIKFNPNDL